MTVNLTSEAIEAAVLSEGVIWLKLTPSGSNQLAATAKEVEAEALKRVIVWQIQQAMGHTGVTITTLVKVGRALGMTWTLQAGEDNGSDRAA